MRLSTFLTDIRRLLVACTSAQGLKLGQLDFSILLRGPGLLRRVYMDLRVHGARVFDIT